MGARKKKGKARKKEQVKKNKPKDRSSGAAVGGTDGSTVMDFSSMSEVEIKRCHGLRYLSDLSRDNKTYNNAEEVRNLTKRLVEWGYEKNPIFLLFCNLIQMDDGRVAKNSFSYQCVKDNIIRTEPLENARQEKMRLAVYLNLELNYKEFLYLEATVVNFDPRNTQLATIRKKAPSWRDFMHLMFLKRGADFSLPTGSEYLEKIKICILLDLDSNWEWIAYNGMESKKDKWNYDFEMPSDDACTRDGGPASNGKATEESSDAASRSGGVDDKAKETVLPDIFPPLVRNTSGSCSSTVQADKADEPPPRPSPRSAADAKNFSSLPSTALQMHQLQSQQGSLCLLGMFRSIVLLLLREMSKGALETTSQAFVSTNPSWALQLLQGMDHLQMQ